MRKEREINWLKLIEFHNHNKTKMKVPKDKSMRNLFSLLLLMMKKLTLINQIKFNLSLNFNQKLRMNHQNIHIQLQPPITYLKSIIANNRVNQLSSNRVNNKRRE